MNTRSQPNLLLAFALVLLALLPLFSGCTSTSYTDPSGAKFSRVSFLNRASVGKVVVKAGDKTLQIEGYSNVQTETAAAVAGAVAAALAPVPK